MGSCQILVYRFEGAGEEIVGCLESGELTVTVFSADTVFPRQVLSSHCDLSAREKTHT